MELLFIALLFAAWSVYVVALRDKGRARDRSELLGVLAGTLFLIPLPFLFFRFWLWMLEVFAP
jgi:hypothetical protein